MPPDVDGVHAGLKVAVRHVELGAALAAQARIVSLEHAVWHTLERTKNHRQTRKTKARDTTATRYF